MSLSIARPPAIRRNRKLNPFYGPFGLIGKDVSGLIELRYNGKLIERWRYSSRKARSEIINDWRESIGTPYHDNEYYLIIKNDL